MTEMLDITCSGTPYELGFQHGLQARQQVLGTLSFYQDYLCQVTQLSWNAVKKTSTAPFLTRLQDHWPDLWQEMLGISKGARVDVEDILTINIRTEIAFGMFQTHANESKETDRGDGCTSVAWHGNADLFLAQNWDWRHAQSSNLIILRLNPLSSPRIRMVTEAGIVGKIGFNEHGVGVTLNALRASGVNWDHIPVHLALRLALECSNLDEVIVLFKKWGLASACHILAAGPGCDASDCKKSSDIAGIECSIKSIKTIKPDNYGGVYHSNNYLLPVPEDVIESIAWPDSPARIARMRELLHARIQSKETGFSSESRLTSADIWDFLGDRQGFPSSIFRTAMDDTDICTLFSIVMDLNNCRAEVRYGNNTENKKI
ncbi:putative acyl-coenzyme A:6-aminopenicillanic-acid-acyltransferase 40 kDa form [Nadsonia fulvescens var. elongata DSM 6958]|uniref:Putative acyl-coenzyme A:6-aminopenicillanic-acid-acyltransferase 40 kDa form n=1 Tax=Nadsonia fulvescens var. elongata DSM 6958 TaxID=857566 RepID=A0A1E3PN84_9ASCO|nr:putative acyl-coenzyme A:6-aminopenicillanic-acid-acyltransferase 40 kDa form [Nadsonia fulvescens var. elongata DSM 6958]